MTSFVRGRVLPVLGAAVAVALVSVYFRETGQTIYEDRWLSLALVAGWALIALQMLVGTARWDLLRLGLVVTAAGLVLFFGRFVVNLWDWWNPGPWMDAGYRACFAVSIPFLIAHSVVWFWHWLALRFRDGEGPRNIDTDDSGRDSPDHP